MAEAVFRKVVNGYPEVADIIGKVDSAASSFRAELPPSRKTLNALADHGIHDYDHTSRPLELEDFFEFTHIFVMDRGNLEDMEELRYRARTRERGTGHRMAKIVPFGSLAPLHHPPMRQYPGRHGRWKPWEIVDSVNYDRDEESKRWRSRSHSNTARKPARSS